MRSKEFINYKSNKVDALSHVFAIKARTLAFAILVLLIISDMLAGPLRYYLSYIGMEVIIYFPKIMCIAFVMLEFYRNNANKKLLIVILVLIASSIFAMINDSGILPIFFSFFLISPFFCGMALTQYVYTNKQIFISIMAVVLIITAFGIYLDYFVTLPWSGFIYNVGGAEIEGVREWTTQGLERCAGFARMSTSAAFYLVSSSLVLLSYNIKKTYKSIIFMAAFPAILMTTSKAGILGFVFGLFSLAIVRYYYFMVLFIACLVLSIICLPISTMFWDYKIDLTNYFSLLLLASFEDRLNNTWPLFISGVSKLGNYITGVGFGGVGTAIKYFSRSGRDSLQVADNFALYLYGEFGVLAIIIIAYLGAITVKLFYSSNKINKSFAVFMVAMLSASLTTDIIEAQAYAVMFGIALASRI